MKKILFFLFLIYGCTSKYASNEHNWSSLQIIDRHGLSETISAKERLYKYQNIDFYQPQPYQQVVQIFNKDKSGKIPAIITSYHPNGQLWQSLEVKDGRAFGKYRIYWPSGNLQLEAQVIGGPASLTPSTQKQWLFDGLCRVWDEQKNLIATINYEKGSLEKTSNYFYKNGKISKSITYLQNQIDGNIIKYKPNEDLLSIVPYKKGKKEGKAIGYWEKDKKSFIEEYEKGCLKNGKYFSFDSNLIAEIKEGKGKRAIFKNNYLKRLIKYRQGKSDGKVQTFSPEGELSCVYHLKQGKKHGEEIHYYLKDEVSTHAICPKLSFYWDDHTIHGTVKSWYENGKLESQKEMCRNKKNGVSCGWYRNGNLMLVEEYENDILLKGTYYKKNQKDPISRIIEGNGVATIYDGDGILLRKIRYQNGKPIE